jgi:UDP-2,3-diacylglucosamine pyrophosphatase LpxH
MKREIVGAAMLLLAPSCAHLEPAPPLPPSLALGEPRQPAGARTEIFVSDLHLGPGRLPDHRWDPYEDFRWGDAFARFLAAIDDGKTDLVLAGDSFELWQYHAPDCGDPPDVGCSEEVSMAHLAVALRAHAAELLALGRFAASGENRVVFLPGNHDAGLLFPRAAALVVEATRAPADRVAVSATGAWVSADRALLSEHGHQMDRMNRFPGWPRPFTTRKGQVHLWRPWGEQFVRIFYSPYEQKYPVVDNILSDGDAMRLASAAEGSLGLGRGMARFAGMLLVNDSWSQRLAFLGNEAAPSWDIARIRTNPLDFVRGATADLPAEVQQGALAPGDGEREAVAGIAELSDDEIRAVCERIEGKLEESARAGVPTRLTPCPQRSLGGGEDGEPNGTLGGVIDRFRSRDKLMGQYLAERAAALGSGTSGRFHYYVFGHTHFAEPTRSLPGAAWPISVVNTGAWQRVVSKDELERRARAKGGRSRSTLTAIELEDLPACYSFVQSGCDGRGKRAEPVLRFFSEATGSIAESCPR